MKKIQRPNDIIERPKFSWIKCCTRCPSKSPASPEALDIYSWSFDERIETTFVCAWRTEGNCYLNQKKTFYGSDAVR